MFRLRLFIVFIIVYRLSPPFFILLTSHAASNSSRSQENSSLKSIQLLAKHLQALWRHRQIAPLVAIEKPLKSAGKSYNVLVRIRQKLMRPFSYSENDDGDKSDDCCVII